MSTALENSTVLVSLLIVEDEPRYLESARLLLAPHLSRIDTALNGAQAHACLARQSYDLILLDLRLPDSSGHEIMAYLREHHPGSLIIKIGRASCRERV